MEEIEKSLDWQTISCSVIDELFYYNHKTGQWRIGSEIVSDDHPVIQKYKTIMAMGLKPVDLNFY